MQKKYSLLALAFALILGTIVASLPIRTAKAPIGPGEVRFYVVPSIVPSETAGTMIIVEVWIESDIAWDDTSEGIVGWGLSVRVDPRALEVMSAAKIFGGGGFLEDFLARYMYDIFEGYTTSLLVGPIDKDTGTILDIAEYIVGYETLGVGGGGGPTKLMRIIFKSRSDVIPSVIDIFGIRVPPIIEFTALYTTPDGVDHYVDVLDDGYYIAQTLTTMYFDSDTGWTPSTSPLGWDWEELSPGPPTNPPGNDWWSLDNWIDNDFDSVLSIGDQIYMRNTANFPEDNWFYVDVVNPAPASGDGKADLQVTVKPDVPEFPLGVALMIAIAPAIPVVYLWRTRKKVGAK